VCIKLFIKQIIGGKMKRWIELEILRKAYDWSLNGTPGEANVWNDFVNIAHNTMTNLNDTFTVDFEKYVHNQDFVLFGKCLSLFENRSYDEITSLIDEVLQSVQHPFYYEDEFSKSITKSINIIKEVN
tara:strand:+ start:1412 stop:1795 length:384 start_codon:yes stop_codon:yes gene_type:complete